MAPPAIRCGKMKKAEPLRVFGSPSSSLNDWGQGAPLWVWCADARRQTGNRQRHQRNGPVLASPLLDPFELSIATA
jgi:hypothetical protein